MITQQHSFYGAIYFNSTFQNIESSHVDPRDRNKLYGLNGFRRAKIFNEHILSNYVALRDKRTLIIWANITKDLLFTSFPQRPQVELDH